MRKIDAAVNLKFDCPRMWLYIRNLFKFSVIMVSENMFIIPNNVMSHYKKVGYNNVIIDYDL